jgi:hypothetical protein
MGRGDSLKAGETDRINTAGDGMRHLINRIKDANAPDEPDSLTRAMLHWYADNRRDELDTMLKAAAYDNVQRPLSRAAAKDLFCRKDGSLSLSASSIGSYIDCPFRYFIDRGLRPKEERTFASDARSVGDVYHECLMAVARQIMKADEIPDDDSLEELVTVAVEKEKWMAENTTARVATGSNLIDVDGGKMPKRKAAMFDMGSEQESLICFKHDAGVYKMVYQTLGYTAIREVNEDGTFAKEEVRVVSNSTLNTKCVPPTVMAQAIADRFSGAYAEQTNTESENANQTEAE